MTKFRDIIGQEMTVRHLKGAISSGKVAHAYIFDGEKGMGKKTLSSVFVKALLCEESVENREDTEPCGVCHSCIMADSGSHPDIIVVTHEKPNSIGVDEIREQVVNDVLIRPYGGKRKVYVIPDAHLMTVQAQNALLKTLEEPPGYAVIILLPDNRDMLLPTLISRSVCLSMRALRDEDIYRYLKDKKGLSEYEADTLVSFAGGNLGKAELLSESDEFRELWEEVKTLLTGIRRMSDIEVSQAASKAQQRKDRKEDYLSLLLLWFRDVLFIKSGGDDERVIFKGEIRELSEEAGYYSFEHINNIIEAVKDARSKMESNVNPEYTYELLFCIMR